MVKLKAIASVLTLAFFCSHALAQDKLVMSQTEGNVTIEAWEDDGGGSGYTHMRNKNNYDVDICWKIHFNSGRTSSGCNTGFEAHDDSRSSCFSCSRKNGGGINQIEFTKNEPSN